MSTHKPKPKRRRRKSRSQDRAWMWIAAVAVLFLAVVIASLLRQRGEELYITDDVEVLARVIRSEAGISSVVERVHIAWATRNLAASRKQSISQMACSPCGDQGAGRPVASGQSPTDEDRLLARHILAAPALVDPTGGATNFINPALQDKLAKSGRAGYRGRSYRRVRRTWQKVYHWEPYYRLSDTLELWGPIRTAK